MGPPHVALIGCGRWGRNILRDLIALGGVVSVIDPDPDARAAARGAGATSVESDITRLPLVQGAVVATPTTAHAAAVDALLPLAIPIFCEKPLCADPVEAERLAAAAAQHLFVMDKWRYHPGVEALAAIARSGELGSVTGLRTTRLGGRHHADVDAVWILAPHELSIGLEILGTLPHPVSAFASRDRSRASALVAVLGGPPWHVFEVAADAAERRREVVLYCGDAIAMLPDAESPHIVILRAAGQPEHRPLSGQWPLQRELRAFLEHLGGGPPPKSSAAEGAAAVRTIARLRVLAGLEPASASG
jgi:predicted dehydrogenase